MKKKGRIVGITLSFWIGTIIPCWLLATFAKQLHLTFMKWYGMTFCFMYFLAWLASLTLELKKLRDSKKV